jgi:predicted amidohydrolase
MRVSAVRLPENIHAADALQAADTTIARAAEDGVGLAVFPACTGMAYGGGQPGGFFAAMREISRKYPDMGICPGSMRENDAGRVYHCSELILGGEILLRQRQLYLSRGEREEGLSRGETIEYVDFKGYKTCIVMGADVFYPQVSRMAALEGAELALCPVAYPKRMGRPLQAAGVWREAQLNLFFAVESCFRGAYGGEEYGGEQTVQGPLGIDIATHGLLSRGEESATAELDRERRHAGISKFDVLAQLNPALYGNMGMFGGGEA